MPEEAKHRMSKQTDLPASVDAASESPDAVPEPDRGFAISPTTRSWLVVLTVLIVGVWMVVAVHLLGGYRRNVAPGPSTRGRTALTPVEKSYQEGDWGRIELIPIVLSPPLELVPEVEPTESTRVEWHFPKTDTLQLSEKLSEIGIAKSLAEELVSMAEFNSEIDGLTIRPRRKTVLGLDRDVRSALYVALAGFPLNRDQRNAFREQCESPAAWFAGSTVSPETRRLVEPLMYRHGDYLFFADLRSIEPQLPSADERLRLIQTLRRNATFLVKLHVPENADVEGLTDYWGRGGRENEVRPIIESLSKIPGGQSIDISRLLPPFAQSRLYTYPTQFEVDVAVNQNCHWTTMNFFNELPEDRFCNTAEVLREVQGKYYRVHNKFRFGDVLFLLQRDTIGVHSAVYIAGDLFFTKNGSLASDPWVLSTLEAVKGFYPRHETLEARYYRRKDL